MEKIIANIQKVHNQFGQAQLTLISLENAVLIEDKKAIASLSKKFANQLQEICAPHIKVALKDNFEIMDAAFKAANTPNMGFRQPQLVNY